MRGTNLIGPEGGKGEGRGSEPSRRGTGGVVGEVRPPAVYAHGRDSGDWGAAAETVTKSSASTVPCLGGVGGESGWGAERERVEERTWVVTCNLVTQLAFLLSPQTNNSE